MSTPSLVTYNGATRAVMRKFDDFGFSAYDLVALPRRLLGSENSSVLVETAVDARRVQTSPSPSALLQELRSDEPWLGITQRTLARVNAAFLVAEDPQRRLEFRKAATLMHQVSLVQHVLESSDLKRVLIADEVGLGKTIEAGLIISRLVAERPSIRVLYLAPARLVRNVASEFRDKLDLDARQWVSGASSDARLQSDRIVVASIHKGVFGKNFRQVVESGPWDVIVVDECHHLSDWGANGGKPNDFFRMVSQLSEGLPSDGRLILMSGTPHQGNENRFKNLLRLLGEDRSLAGAAGKVIYRTKDRVRDWKGNPLFPGRTVNSPTIVQLGRSYEAWYRAVGELYDMSRASGHAKIRATGWAKGQALQWAASSVQAGLGFLIRLAIRRLGWNLKNQSLATAISAIRPYRGGAADEPLEALYARMIKQVQAQISGDDDLGDDEEVEIQDWRPDGPALADLLEQGVKLLSDRASSAKWEALVPLIDAAGEERIVFFAQPVETVAVVADFLERRFGQKPSIIIGNQSDDERRSQIEAFQREGGRRFLVSSRAGGEGLNMQRARRLIHLDVPWNPMEMEQRIGRIHRFGSRRSVIVDTVVASGSREIDMYRVAREKLKLIVRQLDPEQFDALFGRVMSLVPPKELEEVFANESLAGSISDSGSHAIGRLVQQGYQSWRAFDDAYRENADKIQSANAGTATWADLGAFLVKYCGAKIGPNTTIAAFGYEGDEIVANEETLPTLQIGDRLYACGDAGGMPADAIGLVQVHQIGTNVPEIADLIRRSFAPDRACGPGYLNRFDGCPRGEPSGALFFLRQTIRHETGRATEEHLTLHTYLCQRGEQPVELREQQQAKFIRQMLEASRVKDPQITGIESVLAESEATLVQQLRRPNETEIANQIRHVVWPIAAIVML